jgi:hypothetical protein
LSFPYETMKEKSINGNKSSDDKRVEFSV